MKKSESHKWEGVLRTGESSYRVSRVRNLTHRGERVDGVCQREHKKILVDASLGRRRTMMTLAHEIMHACYIEDDTNRQHDRIYAAARVIANIAERIYGIDNKPKLARKKTSKRGKR